MRLISTLCIIAGGAICAMSAQAATVTPSFDFSGSIQVGGGAEEELTEYPGEPGVERRRDDPEFANSFATVTGTGFDDPVDGVTFANGANAFGEARATSNNRIVVTITNEEAVAQSIIWNGTIFAGGVGIVEPDVGRDSNCSLFQLDSCDSYNAPGNSHDASAELIFGAVLNGEALFDGRIFASDTEVSQALNGISLNNLRLADDGAGNVVNDQYFWWDETNFTIDLGVLEAGESVTLEFFVMIDVISSGLDGCGTFEGQFQCIGAQAGFGDPDNTGGNNHFSALSYRSLSYSSSEAIVASPVPLPAGVWLFGTFLAGAFGARQVRRRK